MNILTKELLYHVLALRYAEGVVGVVANIIIDLGIEIADELSRQETTEFQQWRLHALTGEVEKLAVKYIANAESAAISGVADAIPVFERAAASLVNGALGVDVMTPTITDSMIRTITENEAVLGQPSAEFWAKQPGIIKDRFTQIIRAGMAKNETVAQMVARLKGGNNIGGIPNAGLVGLTSAQAEALVRTSVANANNLTKLMTWQKSPDTIKDIQWVATLDNRTTPICRALDGKQWDLMTFEPVKHDFPFPGPIAHYNCRSTQIPVMRTFEDIATKNKALARKLDAMLTNGERAAMGAPVPKMNFSEWLRALTPGQQKQVLGMSKWRLWSSGKVTIDAMVSSDLRALTLKELREAYK